MATSSPIDVYAAQQRLEVSRITITVLFLSIGLGIPAGWMSTGVHRESLDIDGIDNIFNRSFDLTTHITFFVDDSSKLNAELMKQDLEKSIATDCHVRISFDIENFETQGLASIQASQAMDEDACLTLAEAIAELNLTSPAIYLSTSTDASKVTCMCTKGSVGVLRNGVSISGGLSKEALTLIQNMIFRDSDPQFPVPIAYEPPMSFRSSAQLSHISSSRMPNWRRSYHLAFTLVNSDPTSTKASWNAAEVLQEYLDPFIESLSDVIEFSVSTEIQNFSPILSSPVFDTALRSFVLEENSFSEFASISSLQQKNSFGNSARIKFLVYIPSRRHYPLMLRSKSGKILDTSSFIIPQWGAVHLVKPAVYDTDTSTTSTTVEVDVKEVLQYLFPLLRKVIGVPIMQGLAVPNAGQLEKWEVERFQRKISLQAINKAEISLQGIRHLVDRIPNMVVGKHIQEKVASSVKNLELMLKSIHGVQAGDNSSRLNLQAFFELAQETCFLAESAFYDHTMLELLYFPEDEKYAVYIPFLIPTVATVLGAGVRLLKNDKR